MKRCLTIAGSDSGGGAGIQADLKTFSAFKVFGTSVLTCVTSQNTLGVDGIHDLPQEMIVKQLNAVLSDIGTDAVKIGMLYSTEIIESVAETLVKHHCQSIVVDPVMVATSGAPLLDPSAIDAFKRSILPLADILTPNLPEAEMLLGRKIESVSAMKSAARDLSSLGPKVVILKGGHCPIDRNGIFVTGEDVLFSSSSEKVIDLVYIKSNNKFVELWKPFIKTKNTHGTGCTLSSAIAAGLANGNTVLDSIKAGTEYVQHAILNSTPLGKGNGPLNHFHALSIALFPKPTKHKPFPIVNYLINNSPSWNLYVNHPFVSGLQDGTLPLECFIHYIKQDYHYLKHYARAHGIGSFKASTFHEMEYFSSIVLHIAKESSLHVNYCKSFGISLEELESTKESSANLAYTRYVIDKGTSGSILDLRAAIAPCLIGYGEIGMRLYKDHKTKKEGNPYWTWIQNYASSDFQDAVFKGKTLLEDACHRENLNGDRLNEILDTFETATKLEVEFWQMGLDKT